MPRRSGATSCTAWVRVFKPVRRLCFRCFATTPIHPCITAALGVGPAGGAKPDHLAVAVMACLRGGGVVMVAQARALAAAQASGLDRALGGADGVL